MSSTRKRLSIRGGARGGGKFCILTVLSTKGPLLLLRKVVAQKEQQKCFKLTKSTSCPDFQNFSVKSVAEFKDVKDFDNFINNSYAVSNSFKQDFASAYGCNARAAEFQRFHRGFLCSYFITQGGCPENIKVENSGLQVICKEQCNQFIESTRELFTNPAQCTTQTTNEQSIARTDSMSAESEFALFCELIPDSFNHKAKQCSRGLEEEFKLCGFLSLEMAESFCSIDSRSNEDCCLALNRSSMSSDDKNTVFNIGNLGVTKKMLIATGSSVGGAILLLSIIVFIIISRKRRKQRKIASSIESLSIRESSGPDISGPQDNIGPNDTNDVRLRNYLQDNKDLSRYQPNNQTLGSTVLAQDQGQNTGVFDYGTTGGPTGGANGKLNNEYTTGLTYVSTAQPNFEKKDLNEPFENMALDVGGQNMVKVIRPYSAELSDELTLVKGDLIVVDEVFDDDWAVGKNEATGEVGMFPMVCVESLNADQRSELQNLDKKISNRNNSLVYSANVGL